MGEPPSSRVVQLTPPGRGAIATLLVEGPDAVRLVESGFRASTGRPLASYPTGRIVVGRFQVGSHPGEDVVVCRRSERSLELHCHGGYAAVARICQALAEQGCRTVSWQDWAAEDHPDPLKAAAHVALAGARTERTAVILLDQYHGALRRAAEAIGHSLRAGHAPAAQEQLQTLLARARLGRHLVEPWPVVLAGPPNSGKSSLINALVGYQRAIVHPTAGTTRDVVSATTAIDGWPLALCDTAGLRDADETLEQAGVALAQRQLASAELVLLVFDLSQPWSEADQTLVERWPDGLVVHNKCDLVGGRQPPRPAGLLTSALRGQGIEQLASAIAERLVPDPPPPGGAVPFTARQVGQLQTAAAALARGDLRSAIAALDGLS